MNIKLVEIMKSNPRITVEDINNRLWKAMLAVKNSDSQGELSAADVECAAVDIVDMYYSSRIDLGR